MKWHLDQEAAALLHTMTSSDDAEDATPVTLFVGESRDDDGKPVYGLHAYESEYPEEGVIPLVEFPAQQPVAWRVRGYNQFKTGTPGQWRYFDGADRPKVNNPEDCDMEPLYGPDGVSAVPPGWMLVPAELTQAMREAWDTAPNGEDDGENMRAGYRAMLAAAPSPPGVAAVDEAQREFTERWAKAEAEHPDPWPTVGVTDTLALLKQEPLGEPFQQVLTDNLESLYDTSDGVGVGGHQVPCPGDADA